MVFYSNFFESEAYHKAYYASISALERWELVTKQRQPWYIWSGWFILWIWTWSTYNSDWWSDKNLSGFSYLWNNENDTSVFRTVDSRTTRIPKEWKWDIEWTLSYENAINPNDPNNSDNYNMMDYENAEIFLLYYDDVPDKPYVKINDNELTPSQPEQITWEIRLPELLRSNFWPLKTGSALVWQQGSLPVDDPIVDRQIRWTYMPTSVPFTIYSTQKIHLKTTAHGQERDVDYDYDNVFREKYINEKLKFRFWENRRSPILNAWNSVLPTIISKNEEAIYDLIRSNKFNKIFNDTSFKETQLRFSLLNLLQWSSNRVYPFLEYYTDFWTIVPDKYYTIDGEWNYKDYQINTIVQKPTVKETILWSFTSIFW